MSRYRGPKLRITRRLGVLPGLTQKRSKKIDKPGQHGKNNEGKKITEYGIRLNEKQKLKFNYGITEKQLFSYVKEARRRQGVTSLILLQLLEMRLDAVCFNLGFAPTIAGARQLINHGHILVNEKSINIPSFQCQINDTIKLNSKKSSQILTQKILEKIKLFEIPDHLMLDRLNLKAKVLNYCTRENILLNVNELLVIEYYSRR